MYFRAERKGFTLIEVIIVIALLGVILGIGIPAFLNSSANRQLDAAAQELLSNLKYAQQIAHSEGSASVDFTKPPAGKAIYCGYSVLDSAGSVKYCTEIPSSVNLSAPASAINFNTNGSANVGGDITLSSKVNSKSKTITIVQDTGMCTLR